MQRLLMNLLDAQALSVAYFGHFEDMSPQPDIQSNYKNNFAMYVVILYKSISRSLIDLKERYLLEEDTEMVFASIVKTKTVRKILKLVIFSRHEIINYN